MPLRSASCHRSSSSASPWDLDLDRLPIERRFIGRHPASSFRTATLFGGSRSSSSCVPAGGGSLREAIPLALQRLAVDADQPRRGALVAARRPRWRGARRRARSTSSFEPRRAGKPSSAWRCGRSPPSVAGGRSRDELLEDRHVDDVAPRRAARSARRRCAARARCRATGARASQATASSREAELARQLGGERDAGARRCLLRARPASGTSMLTTLSR